MGSMGEDQPQPAHQSARSMAAGLEPALREACDRKLGPIRWFSADWQHGGASTGYSTYECDEGEREVVVKLPLGPLEYRFTHELGVTDSPTPRVMNGGTELGGYDMGWVVMERVQGKPLQIDPDTRTVREVLVAAASFHARALEIRPVPTERKLAAWADLLETARAHVHDNPIPHQQLWNEQVKRVQRISDSLVSRWRSRPINTWCHGDLHLGNAMRREEGSPWGEPGIVLIDLGHVHPGHWVEDAVYFERVSWGRDGALAKAKPVSQIAKARKKLGLEVGEDANELADIRRVLTASCAPAFLQREGSPRYLEAALHVLESLTPRFSKQFHR
ncbi:MAG: aminoglycoside phosphotransferase family protein [Phycisphaerales bacterium JB043]